MKPWESVRPLPPAKGLRRRAARLLAGLLALAVPATAAVVVPATNAAAEPAVAPSDRSVDPSLVPGAAATTHELTLITGDRVELTIHGPEGPYETNVVPADRPGMPPTFLTDIGPDGVYVVPSDVSALVQSGRVDRELFNVTGLVELGYADAETDTLPVIVGYPAPAGAAFRAGVPSAAALAAQTDQLPATDGVVGLASVNGAGVAVVKEQAAEFWQQLQAASRTTRSAAVTPRVWLDGVAELVLDQSAPLVGAPEAWAAGYDGTGVTVAVLDSGIDQEHPDVVDRLVAAESFVAGSPAQDRHGHGTHVASTIAGTGAASGGRYTGVAPGANLLSGRVCTDGGQCSFSDMIAGMEWATQDMGADIVSISLGADPSDGTDPVSQAVNNLTARTGALFVIAAGNNGRDLAVSAPGAADAALTVAATTKRDTLAGFSSRGPRVLDLALKPDIAAPGVDIVAARSATGTDMGGNATPVGEHYVRASGTSMATPHVSGAAAILAQRYPDWGPEALKAALMSTAVDAGSTVYQQGAGRLDVARAATQQVYATTANLDFGIVEIPAEGAPEPAPITRQVSYTNLADQPVTLVLASSLATVAGEPVAPQALTTDSTVTIPAGDEVTVDVTLDVTGLGRGWYTGAVVATDDVTGTRVTTPVGLVREPPKVTLTIRTLGRDGQPAIPGGTQIIDVSGPGGFMTDLATLDDGVTAARVPEGVYSAAQLISWIDDDSRFNTAWLFAPEVIVDGDTEIILDGRQARQITFDTPEPSEPLRDNVRAYYQRTAADGERYAGVYTTHSFTGGPWSRIWATPTGEVAQGDFQFTGRWTLGQAEVHMSLTDPVDRALDVVASLPSDHPAMVRFDGVQERRLVDAGFGTPDELAGVDLTGALVLMEAGLFEGALGPQCGLMVERIRAARDAGAAAVLAFPSRGAPCPLPMPVGQEPFTGPAKEIGLPFAFVPTGEGHMLRDLLAGGPVEVRVEGTPNSPYAYWLAPYEEGRISDSLAYTFTDDQLATFDEELHATDPTEATIGRYIWKQRDVVQRATSVNVEAPSTFRGYVGPVDPELMALSIFTSLSTFETWNTVADVVDRPGRSHRFYFAVPPTPGAAVPSGAAYATVDPAAPPGPEQLHNIFCTLCREGNFLVGLTYLVVGAPDQLAHDNHSASTRMRYRLLRDGREITPIMAGHLPFFQLPEQPGSYRLELEAPQTETAWTFSSSAPTDEAAHGYFCLARDVFELHQDPCGPVPAVFVSYDLGDSLAIDNTVRARGVHKFDVYAYHHPSPAPMPEIAGLKLWASYDGGERWTEVRVRDQGDGRFEAQLVHPRPERRASDQVSLKVEAWDADGNRIEQVTHDAFTLKEVNTPEANVAS